MVAWGLTNGQWTPQELVSRVVAKGYKWLAVEWDDPQSQAVNRALYPQIKQALNAQGVMCGPWFTEGGNVYLTPPGADLTIAELEGPGDYIGIKYAEEQGWVPQVPKAVCTNFSTIGLTEAQFLINHGYSCLTESYLNEAPSLTPDNQDRVARNLGWPTSQPVFGVYATVSQPNPVPLYNEWQDWPGVDYLGEYVL